MIMNIIYYNIIKISDDYFIVDMCKRIRIGPRVIPKSKVSNYNPITTFYRCDQIEGVIKLLEDKTYSK